MTTTNIILAVHIIGAVLTLVYIFAGLVQIIFRRGSIQASKWAAIGLGIVQVVSGAGLVLTHPGVSVTSLCLQGLVVLAAIVAVQSAVTFRLEATQ